MTIHSLIHDLHERARCDPKTIVLAESEDPRVLEAASIVARDGLAHPILLGEPDAVRAGARHFRVSLKGVEIIDPASPRWLEGYVGDFVELFERRGKAIAERTAYKMLARPLFFAAMMVQQDDAQGAVAGAVNATANVVRPAIYIIGPKEGLETISSAFLVIVEERHFGEQGGFILADPAIIPDPTVEQVIDIAIASANTARSMLATEPRIALLSFSTKGSATHPSAVKMARAARILKREHPDMIVDGEMQIDAALMPEIGQRKAPGSPVAGSANVLVFPDLNSANMVLKVMERLAHAEAYGSYLQGLAKPMSDVSRGASVEDLVSIIASTSLDEPISEAATGYVAGVGA